MSVADLPATLAQAVFASDADAPRLAAADWFEVNGQTDRARYIREQVRLATLPHGTSERWQLDSAMRALLQANRKAWLGSRPELDGVRWEFVRGFPERVNFNSFQDLDRHKDKVFAHPVRRIIFSNLRSVPKLAACPALAQISELDLSRTTVRDEGAARLAASPYLGNITWLNLDYAGIRAAGMEALARSQTLNSLRWLSLDSNLLGAGGGRGLASWAGLANLNYLSLNGTQLTNEGFAALAESPYLGEVRQLFLREAHLTHTALAALADRAAFPLLESLVLSANRLGPLGGGELGRCRHLERLTSLEIDRTALGDQGAIALAEVWPFTALTQLNLARNGIADAGAKALASSPHCGTLRSLWLGGNMIGDEGGWALGRSANFSSLRSLSIDSNAMQGALSKAISERYSRQDPSILDNAKVSAAPVVPTVIVEPPPLPVHKGPIDEAGLWQAIVDDPDDDLPRQIYADWLDEEGQTARAELMRGQLGLVPTVSSSGDGYTSHIDQWLGPLKEYIERRYFERGLLRVIVSMRTFLSKTFQENAAGWFRAARVNALEIQGNTSNWAKVTGSPVMAAVHELRLSGGEMGRNALPALAGSPHLTGLHTLHLSNAWMGARNFQPIIEKGNLPRLRRLYMHRCSVRLEMLHALVRWNQASRFTSLTLPDNWISAAEASVLFTSPTMSGLRHLDLRQNSIGNEGVRALVDSPHLTHLRSLSLYRCNVGPEGALALAEATGLGRLESLDLTSNSISEAGALALANSQSLGNLKRLHLSERLLNESCRTEIQNLLGDRVIFSRTYW